MTYDEIRNKVKIGDYVTLAKMLNISHPAAKMRVLRGNQEAIEALEEIIKSREELIKNYQKDE